MVSDPARAGGATFEVDREPPRRDRVQRTRPPAHKRAHNNAHVALMHLHRAARACARSLQDGGWARKGRRGAECEDEMGDRRQEGGRDTGVLETEYRRRRAEVGRESGGETRDHQSSRDDDVAARSAQLAAKSSHVDTQRALDSSAVQQQPRRVSSRALKLKLRQVSAEAKQATNTTQLSVVESLNAFCSPANRACDLDCYYSRPFYAFICIIWLFIRCSSPRRLRNNRAEVESKTSLCSQAG